MRGELHKLHAGGNVLIQCPVHHDSQPSCSVRRSPTGKLLVRCFAGCEPRDILRALTGMGVQGTMAVTLVPASIDTRKVSAIERCWRDARSLQSGDPVYQYLQTRCINLARLPAVLAYNDRTYCKTETGVCYLPAMLARIDSPTGELVCVHRTYLQSGGTGKAELRNAKGEVLSAKRLMPSPFPGATKGGAIRLFPSGEILGVAEGIETALACHQMTQLPVWATVSATGLESVVLPQDVRQVIIFGDNDKSGCGERTATRLAERLAREGRSVEIRIPAETGRDWNDILIESRNHDKYTQELGNGPV